MSSTEFDVINKTDKTFIMKVARLTKNYYIKPD